MQDFLDRLFGKQSPSQSDKEAWQQRIDPLANQAFELAVARWEKGAPLDETTEAEARQKQSELRAIAKELKDDHPGTYRTYSTLISEALLDFKYALDAPPATSLRLHHYIEAHENA